MRKPAVVVTVAVSAVLAGGIMLATTTAGAEETKAAPAPATAEEAPAGTVDAPALQWPDLPAVPQLPPDAGMPAVPAVPMDPGPGAAQGEPAAQARPGNQADAARPAPARPAAPADDEAPARPAKDDNPAPDSNDKRNKSNQLPDAQRDVTTGQALSTDPRSTMQQQALNMVNENRRQGGCGNLTVDRRLIIAANRHAADMARRGYFAHEDTRGDRAGDRVEDAGYEWKRFGENIARGQDSVFEVVDGWLHSPEHRENIMDCELHQVGVGLAFAGDRTPYWVQDFATPQ